MGDKKNINISIEKTKSSYKTLIYKSSKIKKYIYSKYNPLVAKDYFDDTIKNVKNDTLLIFVGFGLGYQIPKKILENEKVLVVETEKMKSIYSSCNIQNNIYMITESNIDDFLKDILPLYIKRGKRRLQFLFYKPLYDIFKMEYMNIITKIRNSFNDILDSYIFFRRFGFIIIRNILRNITKGDGIYFLHHIQPKRKIDRVIVYGASPSLYDNFFYDSSALTIAVDTAFLPLVKKGIIPEIVVSIDPQPFTYEHFVGFKNKIDTNIIAHISSFYGLHNIKTYYFGDKNIPLYTDTTMDISDISSLLVAIKIAVYLMPKEIILCGVDLEYKPRKLYCKYSAYDRYFFYTSDRFLTIPTRELLFLKQKNRRYIMQKYRERLSFIISSNPNITFLKTSLQLGIDIPFMRTKNTNLGRIRNISNVYIYGKKVKRDELYENLKKLILGIKSLFDDRDIVSKSIDNLFLKYKGVWG